jgi:hypothetical protein
VFIFPMCFKHLRPEFIKCSIEATASNDNSILRIPSLSCAVIAPGASQL